jgi:RNA polymerase sigma-70 factor (ECF subfamily)
LPTVFYKTGKEAEDVVQDTLVKAWKSRWRVRDPEKFPGLDLYDSAASEPATSPAAGGPEPLPVDLELKRGSERGLGFQRHRFRQEVQAALAQLPELHRTAVTLRYFEELDYATIERTLGLTNGALRGILGRALGAMRRKLKPALASIN